MKSMIIKLSTFCF